MKPLELCVVAKSPIETCPPLLRMLRYLLPRGHRADVFCVGGQGKIPDLPDLQCPPSVRVCAEASRRFRPLKPLREISRLKSHLLQGASVNRWDLVVAYDPYALWAVGKAGLSRRTPVVYYSAELWDQPRHWPQRWAQRTSRKDVSGFIACQSDRLEILREAMDLDVPGLEVANSCYDYLPFLQSRGDQSAFARPGKVVFSYQGSSNIHNRCLGEAIEAFGSVQADVVLQMQLVGSDENVRMLQKRIEQTSHPEHFEILGYRPYGEHFAASMSADAALMLYRPDVSLNYRYCAPNKLYEYPMLGLPVLCSNQPHLRRTVEGEEIGLCVAPDDPQAIVRGIEAMLDERRRKAMAGRARAWFLREGRYESWGAKLEAWLEQIAAAGAGAQSLKKAG